MTHTDRLDLPFIAAGQAMKHIPHNDALQKLDLLVQPVVESAALGTPPTSPPPGAAWIVPADASGAWTSHAKSIAVWQAGAWRYFTPAPGWQAFDRARGCLLVFSGTDWIAVASTGAGLPHLGINATPDTTNRLAVAAEAVLLTHDGAGHQLKINKSSDPDTASLVFQSNWVGYAEMGLMGDHDWRLKVSPDGLSWIDALSVASGTGAVTFANDVKPASDNSASLGTSAARWSTIWSATGTIETSDRRLKTDIRPSALGLDFIRTLNPVSYRWMEGRVENGEAQPGQRTHYGFIAQDVAEAVATADAGDFAGHVQSDPLDPDSVQALRYTQFLAPLVKAVQQLAEQIEAIELAHKRS